jgi:hypothetical protein
MAGINAGPASFFHHQSPPPGTYRPQIVQRLIKSILEKSFLLSLSMSSFRDALQLITLLWLAIWIFTQ